MFLWATSFLKTLILPPPTTHQIIIHIEAIRREASSSLDKDKRSERGQYFTPQSIAGFMASLFDVKGQEAINTLDAGAGIGSLSVAFLGLSEHAEKSWIQLSGGYKLRFTLAKALVA